MIAGIMTLSNWMRVQNGKVSRASYAEAAEQNGVPLPLSTANMNDFKCVAESGAGFVCSRSVTVYGTDTGEKLKE